MFFLNPKKENIIVTLKAFSVCKKVFANCTDHEFKLNTKSNTVNNKRVCILQRREDVERCDEWQSQVIEYGGEAVKRQNTCAAAHFVQGLATTKDKNRG